MGRQHMLHYAHFTGGGKALGHDTAKVIAALTLFPLG